MDPSKKDYSSLISRDLLALLDHLFPDIVMIAVRSFDPKSETLKLELRQQKEENADMPETQEVISIHNTVGGIAVLRKETYYVRDIGEEPLFHDKRKTYPAAGYRCMKAYPLFNRITKEIIGVAQVYTNIINYEFKKREEKAIQEFCETIEHLMLELRIRDAEHRQDLSKESYRTLKEVRHHVKNKVSIAGGSVNRVLGKMTQVFSKQTGENISIPREDMEHWIKFLNVAKIDFAKAERFLADTVRFSSAEPKKRKVNITNLVTKTLNDFAMTHEIRIEHELSANIEANIDEMQISIVIEELLENAWKAVTSDINYSICALAKELLESAGKALPEDINLISVIMERLFEGTKKELAEESDSIRCRLFREGNSDICLEVINCGELSEEVSEKAFQVLFTTYTDERSTGVGLPLAKGAIEQHGGRISLNARDGEVIARICLPIA